MLFLLLCRVRSSSSSLCGGHHGGRSRVREYFTNGKDVRANDPFAILGLSWGASKKEIQEAFRKKARDLHPDINRMDSPSVALKKFQALQKAHQTLLPKNGNGDDDDDQKWSFHVWKQSDNIAQNRTDVAGIKRQRPIPPATLSTHHHMHRIGHPNGTGLPTRTRGEYLTSGTNSNNTTNNNSINNNRKSKWLSNKSVKAKQYKPFDPSQSIPPITNTKLNNYYNNNTHTTNNTNNKSST